MERKDITSLFNKFAGKELKDPNRLTTDIDNTFHEMQQIASNHGYKLRVFFPGDRGTTDARPDRVNVYVENNAEGRLIIQNRFKIG
jgi:hypothetical protein